MNCAGKRLDEVIRDWHERFAWNGPGIVAVPSVFELDHPAIRDADQVLASLADFRPHMIGLSQSGAAR